jgi:sulfatase maturation enzyme AslB (radical SAM superfamily)
MDKNDTQLKRKIVMLTLTENCNLSCIYCFEKTKTKKVMDIQVAKDALTYEFQNSEGFDEIEIDLFGGEPTLCIDLIKELVEWTHFQCFSKPYIFFLETNGTLVHGEFQKWLLRNREYVWAGISIDGTPDTHNKNRSNSYYNIDIDFFVNTYPGQSVRMTVNNESINNLSKDIIHLHKLGFESVIATFAYGINWDLHNVKLYLSKELEKLCEFYLENPQIKECSIFDMHLPDIIRKERKVSKWCGSGTNMVSYGIDGVTYPCQTFQQNTTGNKKSIKLSDIDFNNFTDFSDVDCSKCILEPTCPNCYGMNYVKDGNIFKRDKQLCEIVKTRALAISYLKAKKIERNIENMKPNEVYQTIQAINVIQSNF